jgi:hypothetical protein
MSEIERAIEHIADNVKFLKTHSYVDDSLQAHELALTALKEMLSRDGNAPLTWNERINQMTVEEKADVAVIISKRCSTALEKESCPDLTCWQCFIEFLNSPYTEGATK